jgi:AbrB family looped-hinge helix DNA binding protein
MSIAKVERGGRLTLPKAIREDLDIEAGHRVAFVKRGGAISLLPLNESVSDHYGSITTDEPQDFDSLRSEARRQQGQTRVNSGVSSKSVKGDDQ